MNKLKGLVKTVLGQRSIRTLKAAIARTYPVRPVRFRSSAYGVPLVGDLTDATYRYALKGTYGSFVRDCIKKLDEQSIFIDIGANLGVFSVLASQHLSRGKVFSFEPNQNVFLFLVKNLRRNNCLNATALNLAISDHPPGLASLSFSASHTGTGSLAHAGGDRSALVATVDAKFLNALNDPDRSYAVKIDVEGHELSVLATLAKSELFENLRTVIVEVSDISHGGLEGGGIEKFLSSHGFKLAAKSNEGAHRDELYVRE